MGTKIISKQSEGHLKELDRQKFRKNLLEEELKSNLNSKEISVFEAGCGHGHWLTSYCIKYPNKVCVGIDLIGQRIKKANCKKNKNGLTHLHFFKAELNEFLEVIPNKVIFEAIIFLFPDPWPKVRHHKKRMIQPNLLKNLAKRSLSGTSLYFRTDDVNYFEWTKSHIEESPFWEMDTSAPWLYEESTYFQDLMQCYFSLVAKKV